jgi:Phage integrase family
MPRYRANDERRAPLIWQQFQSTVDPLLLTAPKINWDQVERRFMNYITVKTSGRPWCNYLALFLGVATCYAKLDRQSIKSRLHSMHCRFETIFTAYQLTDFSEWDPVEHLTRYMNDPEGPDSLETKVEFMRSYTALVRTLAVYLQALPAEIRARYQQWALPPLPVGVRAQIAHDQDARDLQEQRRKADSDAVSPFFAQMWGEAHLRWNALARLRQKYREVVAQVEAGTATLPVAFSYEEPRYKQQFHFLLWDRPSFILAHGQNYSFQARSKARNKRLEYSPERNHFFLEFVGAENLTDPGAPHEPDALLWFGELLRYVLIGEHANCGTPEEIGRKQAYLRSWGYGEREDEEFATQPFSTGHTGLLTETRIGGQANFLQAARKRTSGLLFTIDTLYDAATFGLAALDFFTTTGARLNELLQLRLGPDCLYAMRVGGTPRLLVRLVPKGRDQPADYIIGPETKTNLERVGTMLKEHYQLKPGESLPHVPYHPDNQRAHLFPGKYPYLFQYHGKHLIQRAVAACLRFLCHGMVFQRTDGTTVILKPHLLRHVFANHLHQVEHVPLDLVAIILHQKDVRVTGYYAAPTWQQVVETTGSFLDRCATQLGEVEDAFVRAPAELQRQWEEARNQVGTLAKVPGGDCTCHAICPYSYVCTGCVYKIPDPARREEIVEQKQWALIRYEQVKRRGMGPETIKMQALIQRCDTELEEMNLIEEYQADENYQPELRIESGKDSGKRSASLAPKTLSTETRAHRAPGQGSS